MMKKDFIVAILFIIFSLSLTQNTLHAYGEEELDSYDVPDQNHDISVDDYFGWFRKCLNYENTIKLCVRDNIQSALKGRPICCGVFKAFNKDCASKFIPYDYFMSFFRKLVDNCGRSTHHGHGHGHHRGSPKPPSVPIHLPPSLPPSQPPLLGSQPASAPLDNQPASAPSDNQPASAPLCNCNQPASAPMDNQPASAPLGHVPFSFDYDYET